MNTAEDLYDALRLAFPAFVPDADREQTRLYGELGPDLASLWFDSLAKALNARMTRGAEQAEITQFFEFLGTAYRTGTSELQNVIDASLVENLFWRVAARDAAPYWHALPSDLQALYVRFHGISPLG